MSRLWPNMRCTEPGHRVSVCTRPVGRVAELGLSWWLRTRMNNELIKEIGPGEYPLMTRKK